MKLLCVIPGYWPALQYGGPIVSIHGLNRALVKKGVDVTVYTTCFGLDGKVPPDQEVNVDGVKVHYFSFVRLLEKFGMTEWHFSRQFTDAVRNNLGSFDLVYIVSVWAYTTAFTAHYCRRYKKPYIITPQGSLYSYTLSKKAWKKLPYFFLIGRRDIKGAAAVHYLTEYEKNKSHPLANAGARSIVIPNGVDIAGFDGPATADNLRDRYPALKNKKVVLFLGRIHWIKGLDILIKAYSVLVKRRKDVHLLIVGPDEEGYGNTVKGWLEEEGISGEVTFTGMLEGGEKLQAFKGSDIFVLPSYSEGFSMSVLEAMYCGLPVIVTDKCHFPEIAENEAGRIISCDTDQLAEAMEKLVEDDKMRTKMGENGKRLVEKKFLWDKVSAQMLESFEDVIKSYDHGQG